MYYFIIIVTYVTVENLELFATINLILSTCVILYCVNKFVHEEIIVDFYIMYKINAVEMYFIHVFQIYTVRNTSLVLKCRYKLFFDSILIKAS